MASDTTETANLSAFLAHCTALGQVRLVLRNCSGFMEMFCSTERLTAGDRWLSIRLADSHLHVELQRVTGVRLRDGGDLEAPARPSIWFHGDRGWPFLLVVLDRTEGDERTAQEAVFRALRAHWGDEVLFDGAADTSHVTFH